MNKNYTISPLGDRSVIVEWEQQIDPVIHQSVMQVFHYLRALKLATILDVIPAYASLTVVFDPLKLSKNQIEGWVKKALSQQAIDLTPARKLEIPVCYHPSLAPDLVAMAEQKEVSVEEIIAWHTEQIYTVYMIGFLPGFPYMGKVADKLAAPRLKQPRVRVPAGSVGIAGSQTGIYPLASPGGWNIIGRTPLRLFNTHIAEPCFCRPGDQVQFVPVPLEDFEKMTNLEHD